MPLCYQIMIERRRPPYYTASELVGVRGVYYVVDDGPPLTIWTTPAWCRRCARLGLAEDLPTLDCFDAKIAEYARWDPEVGTPHVEEYRRRKRWRLARSAPPKCIACGSTDLLILSTEHRTPHPDGAGWITVNVRGLASTNFLEWYFTPDGDRIPTFEIPSP